MLPAPPGKLVKGCRELDSPPSTASRGGDGSPGGGGGRGAGGDGRIGKDEEAFADLGA